MEEGTCTEDWLMGKKIRLRRGNRRTHELNARLNCILHKMSVQIHYVSATNTFYIFYSMNILYTICFAFVVFVYIF